MPSARTDCPARPAGETDSRHGTRAASPAAYRRRRTTRPAPRPDGHAATRRPYAVNLPAQIEQTEPAGEREDIRRGRRRARREKGRKDEDLRPLACRIAAQVIKASNPRPKPAQQEPAPQTSRHHARHRAQLQPRLIFCPLSILLLESLQNPGPFLPVSRRTTAPRPPAWTPPAPGEPSHFRARSVSHETA